MRTEAVQLGLDASELGKRFSALWKQTNRPANVHRMQGLWERLSKYLLIKSEDISAGRFSFDGTLPGPFVTYPHNEKQPVPNCFLRYTFTLDDVGEKAQLQLIANSHATVYLNGKKIGTVKARKSLSAVVEEARVKSWEVSDVLDDGKNIVAVEISNYTGGQASAHVWLQQAIKETWQKPIVTSTYWKAANRSFAGWKSADFDDSQWPNAVDAEIPWEITRPYFDYDMSSRIEYYSRGGN